MKIHYLNCGTDCPLGGRLFDGISKGPFAEISCAAQLIETNDGLVLIDTGYGVQDVRRPHPRLSRTFHALRELKRGQGSTLTLFCSHDAKELEALQKA